MIVYCLFCETQKAERVAGILEKRGIYRAFSPRVVRRQRVQGVNEDRQYALLPGYVFVYSKEEINPSLAFRGIDGIIRRLGRPEEGFRLSHSDYDFAMKLYRLNGVVGQITIFRQGDLIRMDGSLFDGCNGKVLRVDYKKQRAWIEYCFAGTTCRTWIACELLSIPY